MPFGITEEHLALTEMVERWAARHTPPEVVREAFEAELEQVGDHWSAMAEQGLLALNVPEAHGGAGYGPVETAVALERMGAALVPGPVLSTTAAAQLLAAHGSDERKAALLPALADGSTRAAVAVDSDGVRAEAAAGGLTLSGTAAHVPAAAVAEVLLVGARTAEGAQRWAVVDAAQAAITPLDSVDGTRRVARVELDGVAVGAEAVLDGLDDAGVTAVVSTLAAAEAAGVADHCLREAVEYAKVREQFDRPIGKFQAIKHLCADMLVRVEQAQAVAWDAAHALAEGEQTALASAVARGVCFDAALDNAKDMIQILGGIGYTWEHDAHLYLRRASALRSLHGGVGEARVAAARRALDGERRDISLDLPEEQAGPLRDEVRAFIASLEGLSEAERRERIADEGYQAPHWPRPWGRDAGPVEQLVISQELEAAGVEIPDIVIGKWILPTIIAYGDQAQQERFIRPTLTGEISWCQLFSEPGAGSDLASLSTKATRTDGGWVLSGQKVWTSLAKESDWGLCLARTDPSAPKHKGITAFLVDMSSAGIDIRPLTEITGRDLFNEVFLNDVFVPDDCVVGEVDQGWKAARNTLANERVEMSTGSTMGRGVEGVLSTVTEAQADDRAVLDEVGALVCEGQSLALLGFRTTLAQVSGTDPGAASSVRKLLGMGHAQATAECALSLVGPAGATREGEADALVHGLIQTRSLTIAGGTTQVLRNVIGERILGLPRDA